MPPPGTSGMTAQMAKVVAGALLARAITSAYTPTTIEAMKNENIGPPDRDADNRYANQPAAPPQRGEQNVEPADIEEYRESEGGDESVRYRSDHRIPPARRYQSLRTIPLPAAIATAIKNDSIARAMPKRRSPASVSRIELVMASPGTRSMIEPMMIECLYARYHRGAHEGEERRQRSAGDVDENSLSRMDDSSNESAFIVPPV